MEQWVNLAQAQEICQQLEVSPKSVNQVSLDDAYGRRLASQIVAVRDDPSFDQSAMDGFAVKISDTINATKKNPIRLSLVGQIEAGLPASFPELLDGTAISIMTGGAVPPNADGIVIVEDTKKIDSNSIEIMAPAQKHIRRKGENFSSGSFLVTAGTRLLPEHIGLIATTGSTMIECYQQLTIAVIPTGSELVEPGSSPEFGQIYESNGHGISSEIIHAGHIPLRYSPVKDDINLLRKAFDEASSKADVILTSGGVSMGAFDFVRSLIIEEGDALFWRIRMRPGSPPIVGCWNGTPIFGLPGNPVSCHVLFRVLVEPWLCYQFGSSSSVQFIQARLGSPIRSRHDRLCLDRVILERNGAEMVAYPIPQQSSSHLRGLAIANALAWIDPESSSDKGDIIPCFLL